MFWLCYFLVTLIAGIFNIIKMIAQKKTFIDCSLKKKILNHLRWTYLLFVSEHSENNKNNVFIMFAK